MLRVFSCVFLREIDACASGALPATIVLVISNNPGAAGLRRAAEVGIATACIDHRTFPDRESFDRALVSELEAREPDLVILAGFMRILTSAFLTPFPSPHPPPSHLSQALKHRLPSPLRP